ncbi:MAG: HDOD domain-containing protein [Methylomonas sp.]|nr:HDOD domain-containing protein [Methylomonas sp.]PPD21059.1 MAG: histidine kinase [Methylomonas sp.]PPD25312.1 MAG: histidine kinase [Methylomonas sp.]PPD35290.1 MAG: histidine kinase [Methylomonas sp.]PPD38505.1 MAG: histidine kinase [Methylomonas sp.]
MQSSLVNWTVQTVNSSGNQAFTPPLDMRLAVSRIKALPPLPGTAAQIVQLMANPDADADRLAHIIERDPLLTAQIIRWASSALYGYRGQLTTVKDAIVRVLGYSVVLDMALGLSVLAPLKSPKDGVIGTRIFWVHALSSTRLMAKLANLLPPERLPDQQALFLAGLIHNIGFPLLGHQFQDEFTYLNRLIETNPGLSIFNLESFAFGVNHAELGAWLMTTWAMPEVVTNVVYHHHNPFYRGDHYVLNLLTFVNDCLLGQLGIGDAANQNCPESVWDELQINPVQAHQLVAQLHDDIENIVSTAELLTG